ncbi:hypothetical protein AK972_2190 [Pseudomonas yamanorum]|nr:hypothetical protein AK972_2190 [Pseudomonas yamanorum]
MSAPVAMNVWVGTAPGTGRFSRLAIRRIFSGAQHIRDK